MQSKVHQIFKISLVISIALFGFASHILSASHSLKDEKCAAQTKQPTTSNIKENKIKRSHVHELTDLDSEHLLTILKRETAILAHAFKFKHVDLLDEHAEIENSQSSSQVMEELHLIKNALEIIKECNIEPAMRYAHHVSPILDQLLSIATSKKSSVLDPKKMCPLAQIRKFLEMLLKKIETGFTHTENLIEEVAGNLEDLDETFQSRLDIIEDILEECCFSLESKLDILSCAATPIFGPTTITTAGTYCLANSIIEDVGSPAIEIAASGVTLDLNGYTVGTRFLGPCISNPCPVGIQLDLGIADVVIKNGFIVGTSLTNSVGIDLQAGGLVFQRTINIKLENLSIRNWDNGIHAVATQNLVIENVISSFNETGLLLEAQVLGPVIRPSVGINVFRSLFNDNRSAGANFNICEGVYCDACQFDENGVDGVKAFRCSSIQLTNCFATGNPIIIPIGIPSFCGSLGSAFNIDSSTNVVLNNNIACSYLVGYNITNSNATSPSIVCLSNNTAKGNCTDGFLVDSSSAEINATLRNNTANGNGATGTGFGFNDIPHMIATNQYYNNSACNNASGNYSPSIISAPVTSPQAARGFDNVDCSLTATAIEVITLSKLDDCCFSFQSQLDGLNSCCFMLNSKLDLILANCMIT
jgi:hypothetical protein